MPISSNFVSMTQTKPLKDFNGWEMVSWGTFREGIKQILIRQNIDFDDRFEILRFSFQEMQTVLKFNELSQMKAVHQSTDFHLVRLEESKAFYEKLKKDLIHKYDQPQYVHDDKDGEVTTLHWYLLHTHIKLVYDYKYKVIDELGAGAYRIDLYFDPQN